MTNYLFGTRYSWIKISRLETRALTLQRQLEEIALKLYPKDRAAAMDLLANYSKGLYLSALEATDRILSQK